MNWKLVKTFDLYIIQKFLGTFFFTIALIISICIIFDLSEKIDEFIEFEAPFRAIIFDYYFNFVPYFVNLFSGLFTFIAVIFFTSKLAFNSEIIAMLSSGISFRRFMLPFMISAGIIGVFSYVLANFIIPPANVEMQNFTYQYVQKRGSTSVRDVHLQIEPNVYIYILSYNAKDDFGRNFTIEKFEEGKLVSKLTANAIRWNREKQNWQILNYFIRDIVAGVETISTGASLDTLLQMQPEEFKTIKDDVEIMNRRDLLSFIEQQKLRGVGALEDFEIERHRRVAVPFSTFILTLIGASLASRKIRGGIGMHLIIGFGLAFTYIMFQQFAKVFALSGAVSPLIAMWIPNLIYAFIGIYIYKIASR